MAAVSMNIRDHGIIIDDEKKRVQCNYCLKEIGGFFRLKCHLGGIRGDVKPCDNVPAVVQETMRNLVSHKHTDKTYKKNRKPSSPANPQTEKRARLDCSSDFQLNLTRDNRLTNFASTSHGRIDMETTLFHSEAQTNASSLEAQKCIARFFYETGFDINAARSSSFARMISAIVAQPQIVRGAPSCAALRGWMFSKELEEMKHHVREIRDSWSETGCSILLDGWSSENGQYLMNILVHCPKGPVYLRSRDISTSVADASAMQLLIDEVVEEVGTSNVVQIITDSMELSRMLDERKLSLNTNNTIFWSLGASYCLELVLKEIEQMNHVRETLTQAKNITRFFHSDASIFQLMKDYVNSCPDLVSTSKFKFAKPFLTLHNIFSEKENLERMLESAGWASIAATTEKKIVAILIGDESFWHDVEMVSMAAQPILKVLYSINSADEPQIGYIYELMDRAKEKIRAAFENEEDDEYWEFWDKIDNVWDNCLHNPLHAAAFHLNPILYLSENDSEIDDEVESGFLTCLDRMVQDPYIQDDICRQLDLEYRTSSGAFRHASVIARSTHVSPAQWWFIHGEQCPQLQNFAIRILSQTCDGASRYGLRRSMAEKLLRTSSMNVIEQQQLSDQAFLHYNLQLQNFNAEGHGGVTQTGEVDPMDDWVVENISPDLVIL